MRKDHRSQKQASNAPKDSRNVRLDILYPPTGPAEEYSPYAVNLCKSCSHGCFYECPKQKVYLNHKSNKKGTN